MVRLCCINEYGKYRTLVVSMLLTFVGAYADHNAPFVSSLIYLDDSHTRSAWPWWLHVPLDLQPTPTFLLDLTALALVDIPLSSSGATRKKLEPL